jgi:hypothetical protein
MSIRKLILLIIFIVPETTTKISKIAIDNNKWSQKLHKKYFLPEKTSARSWDTTNYCSCQEWIRGFSLEICHRNCPYLACARVNGRPLLRNPDCLSIA